MVHKRNISMRQFFWGPTTGYNFQIKIAFLSLKMVLVLANNGDHGEMPHHAAFHLGLHCLPKCEFRSHLYRKGQMQKLLSFYMRIWLGSTVAQWQSAWLETEDRRFELYSITVLCEKCSLGPKESNQTNKHENLGLYSKEKLTGKYLRMFSVNLETVGLNSFLYSGDFCRLLIW